MILHLVTDRQRLCPGADREEQESCLRRQLRYAIAAGVDAVQIRERDLPGRRLATLVRDVVAMARATTTRVIVNDRLDVALAAGAHGVHLRGDSPPAAAVRPFVPPGFLIGVSVRAPEDAARAMPGADYLIAGTAWPTRSKPGLTDGLGTSGLRAIAVGARVPVLAIGGVDERRLQEVAAAGAAGAAAVGLFIHEDPALGCRAFPLLHLVARARVLFETSR